MQNYKYREKAPKNRQKQLVYSRIIGFIRAVFRIQGKFKYLLWQKLEPTLLYHLPNEFLSIHA